MNEKNINDWNKLKVGDIIVLKDEKTIQELMANKVPGAIRGKKLEVAEVIDIVEQNGACTWKRVTTNEETLIIKSVGSLFEVRKMNRVDWIGLGSRSNLLEGGHFFLFCVPDNPNSFLPKELTYAESFSLDVDGQDTPFDKKNPTMYGSVSVDGRPVFTEVTEYKSIYDVSTPEFMVIETGGLDETGNAYNEGGYVECFEGYAVAPIDIEVLPLQ